MHNLAGLVEHLHLLLGVAVVGEHVNLRNHVVGELVGELAYSNRLVVDEFLVFLLQFGHGSCAGTACALIACDVDALDMANSLKRLEHHYHHDSSTVWVGNDVARTVEGILGVALGHYQRHIVAHTECRRVVNHDCTVLGDGVGKFLRCATASRCEGYVDVLEVVVVLKELHFILLALEGIFLSGRTF